MSDRILIVEDSPPQAEMIAALLAAAGYDCRTAASAEEARGVLVKESFDAVVTDVRLPGDSGFELCLQLKHTAATSRLPVMLLTVCSAPEDLLQGLACGADAFVTKPFDDMELHSVLASVLAAARSSQPRAEVRMQVRGRWISLTPAQQQILSQVFAGFESASLRAQLLAERLIGTCTKCSEAALGQEPCVVEHPGGRYSRLVHSATDAMIAVTLDRRILDVNALAETLFRRSRSQLIGHSVQELIAPDEVADQTAIFERLRAGEPTRSLSRKLQMPDGSTRHADVAATLIDLDGEAIVTATLRDVTDRQRAETRLRVGYQVSAILAEASSSEAACPSVLDVLTRELEWDVAVCWLQDERGLLRCHDLHLGPVAGGTAFAARTRELSFGPGEGLPGRVMESGQPLWVTDARQEEWYLRRTEAALAGFRTTVAVPLKTGERTRGVLELVGSQVRGVDVQLLEALTSIGLQLGQFMERQAQNEAIRASEERIRLLMDSTREAIYGVDLEGRCTFANKALTYLLGLGSAASLIGRHMHELLQRHHPDGEEFPTHQCRLMAHLRRGELFEDDTGQVVLPDGRRIPTEVRASPVFRKGELVGGVVSIVDRTARDKMEVELRQAQKMRAFGQLAGGVAHDFNNLLTVIGGHANLLAEEVPPDSPQRRDVDAICRTVDRAAALTRQLLAFSRKQPIQPKVIDLNVAVREMSQMLHRLIGDNIRLVTVCDAEPRPVMVDPGQLDQVLLNLSVNARDAMPQGGRLSIRVGGGPGGAAECTLSVEDTGCGIAPELLPLIFEPFFTTKAEGCGTGLGLATVHAIVERAGGTMTVESTPGIGTRFLVSFPMAEAPNAESAGALTAPAKVSRVGATVLVVDDEEAVRQIVSRVLHRRGYRVLEASGGEEAVRLFQGQHGNVDLVIADVVMPGMPTEQFARELLEIRPSVRILYMSGYAGGDLDRHGVVPGRHPFVHKPFLPEELASCVESAMSLPES
ncbi:MAG: response regulator [Candidatus Wallbacteria bacterium]|nr:response regulator [Candidatus Wallbacteria bacterium]